MKMLGANKNLNRHGALTCVYGCCVSNQDKQEVRRIVKRRERREWKTDVKSLDHDEGK